jgi:hypothetical protein
MPVVVVVRATAGVVVPAVPVVVATVVRDIIMPEPPELQTPAVVVVVDQTQFLNRVTVTQAAQAL